MTAPARTLHTDAAIATAVAAQRNWVESLFDRLSEGSRDNPGITRDTYGAGEDFGHRLLAEHGKARGLSVSHDFAANTYVTLPGRDASAPRILMGSHLDSVPHGGNFDGAAGVVAGLVVIEALRALGIAPR